MKSTFLVLPPVFITTFLLSGCLRAQLDDQPQSSPKPSPTEHTTTPVPIIDDSAPEDQLLEQLNAQSDVTLDADLRQLETDLQ